MFMLFAIVTAAAFTLAMLGPKITEFLMEKLGSDKLAGVKVEMLTGVGSAAAVGGSALLAMKMSR